MTYFKMFALLIVLISASYAMNDDSTSNPSQPSSSGQSSTGQGDPISGNNSSNSGSSTGR